jgi:tRNA (guanine26-N2/guanine27-N2)-dimethyltransferase
VYDYYFILQDATSITVVGPLWTGPLHDASSITEMLNLAVEWGWAYTSENGITLQKLLDTMIEESDPRLPPGYIKLDEVRLAVTYLLNIKSLMYYC